MQAKRSSKETGGHAENSAVAKPELVRMLTTLNEACRNADPIGAPARTRSTATNATMDAVKSEYIRNSEVFTMLPRPCQPSRTDTAITVRLLPATNMNTVITTSAPRLSKRAIDERVEKPPVERTANPLQTASNQPMPPIPTSATMHAAVNPT